LAFRAARVTPVRFWSSTLWQAVLIRTIAIVRIAVLDLRDEEEPCCAEDRDELEYLHACAHLAFGHPSACAAPSSLKPFPSIVLTARAS
jgi:hypothetical protein